MLWQGFPLQHTDHQSARLRQSGSRSPDFRHRDNSKRSPHKCPVEPGLTYASSFRMAEYRFKIGDLVQVQIGVSPKEGGTLVEETSKPLDGIYRVTRLVPVLVGDEPHYRIKDCFSRVERVVGQSFLTPAVQPRY